MAPITKYLFPILVLLLPFTTGVTTCYRNLKNPIPAGARCGTYGTLTTPKVLREATRLLATENNCRDECMNDVACTAFSVNANTKRCRIYSGTLASMGFKTGPSSGGVRFWERTCYATDCDTWNVGSNNLTPGTQRWDDENFMIDLPFPIKMYGKSTTRVWMSVNGILSFSAPTGILANRQSLPATGVPDVSVFVYWLDAEIQASGVRADPYEDQGLSWEYRNDFLSPTVKFYWKFRYPYNNPVSYLDAQIFWYADSEGPSILSYPSVGSDLGSSATVGSQCTSCNSWSQFTGQVKKFSNILYNPTNQSWYNPF